jgi:hypothetical protein
MVANLNYTDRYEINDSYKIKKLNNLTVDPIIFYLIYLLWKANGESMLKSARLQAANALSIFRCFTKLSSQWLLDDDDLDFRIIEEGYDPFSYKNKSNDKVKKKTDKSEVDKNNNNKKVGQQDEYTTDNEDDDDDEDEIMVVLTENDPEYQWQLAKKNHSVVSESMDKLMDLTGFCYNSKYYFVFMIISK